MFTMIKPVMMLRAVLKGNLQVLADNDALEG